MHQHTFNNPNSQQTTHKMSIDIAAEFDLLKKEIRAYQSELTQSISSLQHDVKELKSSVGPTSANQPAQDSSFAANQHTVASTAFPFAQLTKGIVVRFMSIIFFGFCKNY